MNKKLYIIIIAHALVIVSCKASSNLIMSGAREKYNDPPAPVFSPVSVHDPSLFPSGGNEFYVIGSHLAAAKTGDFMQWRQVTKDWNGRPNMFYPQDNPDPGVQKMRDQIEDVMRGSRNELGFFVGDIHQMPDGNRNGSKKSGSRQIPFQATVSVHNNGRNKRVYQP
jgi:hypothetical protein